MFKGLIEKFGKLKVFGAIGLFVFVVILSLAGIFKSSQNFVPIYTGLSNADKYDVIRLLNQIGAEYGATEDSVLVDAGKVREYRMYLAGEGVPTGGSIVGYEIFNKEEAFSTSGFTQNINLLRALEGEISRTITSFDNIKTARVHLALPKRAAFSKDVTPPSASVILKLNKTAKLTKKETDAISNFVASAVAGLDRDNVTIVSTDGATLKLPSSEDSVSFANHEYKLEMERHLRNVVEDLVGKSLGPAKVRAEVSLDLDFDRLISNAESYDPAAQVLKSSQTTEEHVRSSGDGGNVSVANNVPGGNGSGDKSSGHSSDKTDEISNYEISKEQRKYMKSIGSIKKMSIAVLVDGSYNVDPVTKEATYVARTKDNLIQIRSLVVSAIGFDAARGDKIEVVNMQFSENPVVEEEEKELFSFLMFQMDRVLIAVIIFVFSSLFSFFVLKPIIMKLLDRKFAVEDQAVSDETGRGNDEGESDKSVHEENLHKTQNVEAGNKSKTSSSSDLDSETGDISAVGEKYNKDKSLTKELNSLVSDNLSHTVGLLRRLIKEEE